MTATEFLDRVNQVILNPIIILLFAVATLILFWGIIEFLATASTDAGREAGKKKILWGLVGMFIMFSAYGIIHLILGTFGLTGSANSHQNYIQF